MNITVSKYVGGTFTSIYNFSIKKQNKKLHLSSHQLSERVISYTFHHIVCMNITVSKYVKGTFCQYLQFYYKQQNKKHPCLLSFFLSFFSFFNIIGLCTRKFYIWSIFQYYNNYVLLSQVYRRVIAF